MLSIGIKWAMEKKVGVCVYGGVEDYTFSMYFGKGSILHFGERGHSLHTIEYGELSVAASSKATPFPLHAFSACDSVCDR